MSDIMYKDPDGIGTRLCHRGCHVSQVLSRNPALVARETQYLVMKLSWLRSKMHSRL